MKDEKKHLGTLHQNNSFMNWIRLPLICCVKIRQNSLKSSTYRIVVDFNEGTVLS